MPNLGGWEFVILIGILVLLFGAKRLPDMARSIGQSARVFKGEMKGLKNEDAKNEDTPADAAGATPVSPAKLPPSRVEPAPVTPPKVTQQEPTSAAQPGHGSTGQ